MGYFAALASEVIVTRVTSNEVLFLGRSFPLAVTGPMADIIVDCLLPTLDGRHDVAELTGQYWPVLHRLLTPLEREDWLVTSPQPLTGPEVSPVLHDLAERVRTLRILIASGGDDSWNAIARLQGWGARVEVVHDLTNFGNDGGGGRATPLVIARTRDAAPDGHLFRVNQTALRRGMAALFVQHGAGGVVVGPLATPVGPCLECLHQRWGGNSSPAVGLRTVDAAASGATITCVLRWLTGQHEAASWITEIGAGGDAAAHPLLPSPCCQTCGGAGAVAATPTGHGRRPEMRLLIDERLGIVRRLARIPSLPGDPDGVVMTLAEVAPPKGNGTSLATIRAYGRGLHIDDAIDSALGEAAERYAVAVAERPNADQPYEATTRAVVGQPTHHVATATAAGPTFSDAVVNALLEVIERDAFARAWAARDPGAGLEPLEHPDPAIRDLAERYLGRGLRLRLRLLQSDVAAVVAAIMIDEHGRGPGAALGLGASPSIAAATTRAITEAVQVRTILGWRLQAPHVQRRLAFVELDPSRVVTPEDHGLYYASGRNLAALAAMTATDTVAWSNTRKLPSRDIVPALHAAGHHHNARNITTRDLARAGIYVATVSVTGAHTIRHGAAATAVDVPPHPFC